MPTIRDHKLTPNYRAHTDHKGRLNVIAETPLPDGTFITVDDFGNAWVEASKQFPDQWCRSTRAEAIAMHERMMKAPRRYFL